MKVFNKDKALRQIKLKQNKNTYIKKVSIFLSCFILLIGIIMFTFAKFEQNSEEYTLINGKVKYGGSGDITLSYVVDGVAQDAPPAKGTGYKLKNYECTNADAVWDNSTWRISIGEMTGKVKCNLEFETATSVNVTMYGPPGAVISYTDSLGSHTQTMDSTGKKENVEIGIMNNITFEDTTVAKDPNNLSNNYAKTIDVTSETENVYVMPDGTLYWYGFFSNSIEHNIRKQLDAAKISDSYNLNNITIAMTGGTGNTYSSIFIEFNKLLDVGSKLKTIANSTGSSAGNTIGTQSSYPGTQTYPRLTNRVYIDTNLSTKVCELDTAGYPTISGNSWANNTLTIYALWYE